MITKDNSIIEKLASALDKSTHDLLNLDTKVIASEFLSKDRAIEQIELFKMIVSSHNTKYLFKEKKLLEIGAGVGTLLIVAREKYGIEAFGVDSSNNEFSSFNEISSVLLEEYNLPKDLVVNGEAEHLPFPDCSFDLIYSANVLEHVKDPQKVFSEAIRALKPGGYLQFVIPNYFSFWEGHYGIFWPCITNKFIAKLYIKLLLKNPSYIDTLQLISPFYLMEILRSFGKQIKVIDWGKETFKKRLETGDYSDWATLRKIRPLVKLVQNLKISTLIASVLNICAMQTPIVLTLKKRNN